jgi:hypothetical protein
MEDFSSSELINKLLKLLEEERAKSHELTLLLLAKEKDEITITAQSSTQGNGKLPWNLQKAKLEEKFAKNKYSDVTEVERENNAS